MQTIVVIGATGAQGGGVVRTLSAKGGYAIKAVTRKMESEKAKALAALPNVSLISADLDDDASLMAAFSGAYGVFLVTNFWEHFSAAKEVEQCKKVAAAAKADTSTTS